MKVTREFIFEYETDMTLEMICFYIMKMCEQQKLGNFSQHVNHWKNSLGLMI